MWQNPKFRNWQIVTFAKCTFNMDIDPKCIKNVSTKSCTYKYCPIVFGDITTAQ